MVHVDRLQDPLHDRPSQFKISMQKSLRDGWRIHRYAIL